MLSMGGNGNKKMAASSCPPAFSSAGADSQHLVATTQASDAAKDIAHSGKKPDSTKGETDIVRFSLRGVGETDTASRYILPWLSLIDFRTAKFLARFSHRNRKRFVGQVIPILVGGKKDVNHKNQQNDALREEAWGILRAVAEKIKEEESRGSSIAEGGTTRPDPNPPEKPEGNKLKPIKQRRSASFAAFTTEQIEAGDEPNITEPPSPLPKRRPRARSLDHPSLLQTVTTSELLRALTRRFENLRPTGEEQEQHAPSEEQEQHAAPTRNDPGVPPLGGAQHQHPSSSSHDVRKTVVNGLQLTLPVAENSENPDLFTPELRQNLQTRPTEHNDLGAIIALALLSSSLQKSWAGGGCPVAEALTAQQRHLREEELCSGRPGRFSPEVEQSSSSGAESGSDTNFFPDGGALGPGITPDPARLSAAFLSSSPVPGGTISRKKCACTALTTSAIRAAILVSAGGCPPPAVPADQQGGGGPTSVPAPPVPAVCENLKLKTCLSPGSLHWNPLAPRCWVESRDILECEEQRSAAPQQGVAGEGINRTHLLAKDDHVESDSEREEMSSSSSSGRTHSAVNRVQRRNKLLVVRPVNLMQSSWADMCRNAYNASVQRDPELPVEIKWTGDGGVSSSSSSTRAMQTEKLSLGGGQMGGDHHTAGTAGVAAAPVTSSDGGSQPMLGQKIDFSVTIYHHQAFHHIRHLLCGNDFFFAKSLSHCTPAAITGGKSGASFLISRDARYLVKTMNRAEAKVQIVRAVAFCLWTKRIDLEKRSRC